MRLSLKKRAFVTDRAGTESKNRLTGLLKDRFTETGFSDTSYVCSKIAMAKSVQEAIRTVIQKYFKIANVKAYREG